MRCQDCAHENAPGGGFCTACGAVLLRACASCGRDGPALARFCGWCGTAVADLTPPPAKSGSERKQATVLFADIAGSTELIAGLDAEAARDRLEPLVEVMVHTIRRFGGTVLRTLGDGLKAAFGVPHTQEAHALMACQAALAMQEAIAALPNTTYIRIGLHSGEVVAGKLDTGSAIEQEAQGMTVHLASRIEQVAEPGGICISRACRDLVAAYCDTISLGPRILKGVAEPMEIYRLVGMKPAVNSDHFRGSELVRLHGRETELAILRQAVEDAAQGGFRAQGTNLIGIVAPPGVGKSRLCFEFGEWCRTRQIEVREARAHVFGKATPLLPILEMLRTFFRITPQHDPAEARGRIRERLIALDPALADSLPLLADLLNVADPAHADKPLDPATRHARLREILHAMVKAAGRRTSVLIVEDLHWLDDASRDFVDTMAEAVDGTGMVMVVTFRDPWSAGWTSRAHYREIRLAELDPRDMRELVRALAGDAPELERMVAHVADQSGGNPFFAEELVLSLAQGGVLLGGRGDYRLAPSGWQDPVLPATVEAVIGARIDRLAERQKAVLQVGSVIGKEFPFAVVHQVAGIPEQGLQALLDRLCEAELIQPRAMEAGAGFAFRHPLIQEVAYGMQLRTRRTRLHEVVAGAIGGFDWGQRDEFASLIAHHYEAAGKELEAAMHLQRAARWIGRTNSARALADWKKVRHMMRDKPRTETNDQLRAHAGGQLLSFGWREGMPADEAKLYAEEALVYAREAGNRKHEVMLLGAYGRIMASSGTADEYASRVREALAMTDARANPEGALLLNGLLCQACSLGGRVSEALAANDAALAVVDDDSEARPGVVLGLSVRQMVGFDVAHWVRCLRAKLLVAAGRHDEADAWLDSLFAIDAASIEPINQFIPHLEAIELAWHRHDPATARAHASAIAAFGESTAIPFVVVAALLGQGVSAATAEDYATAQHFFREALATARHRKAGLEYEARLLAHSADAYLRAGDMTGAAATADDAAQVARRRADRLAECHAVIVRAHALCADRRAGWRQQATGLLAHAGDLIAQAGAAVFQPRLERTLLRLGHAG